MKEIINVYLKRIERDAKGLPIKPYPFTRDTESDAAPKSDPRVVVMNPAVSFGRPVIAGTGIPVSSIYERYKAGDSVAELAQGLPSGHHCHRRSHPLRSRLMKRYSSSTGRWA